MRVEELLWKCTPGDSVASAHLQGLGRSNGVKSFTSLKLWWPQGFVPSPQVAGSISGGQLCPSLLR